MAVRPTHTTTYLQVLKGLRTNSTLLARAQEQAATGRSILRPSDDAVGSAIAVSLRRQISTVVTHRDAVNDARPTLALAASELEEASTRISEAQALILQGMNGTMSQEDRISIANQLENVHRGLLEIGNARLGDRFLFAGTATSTRPFDETGGGPDRFVEYQGNGSRQSILIGREVEIDINVPGDEIWGPGEYTSTSFAGQTGLSSGTSADSGSGFSRVHLRTDTVTGFGQGLALAAGSDPSILGDHALVVDAEEGTIRLGTGQTYNLPDPLPAEMELVDDDESTLTVDLSGWSGVSFSGTVTGEGSISADGNTWQTIDRTETNLQLVLDSADAVLHVDTTRVSRSGTELVSFRGATNVFDALLGIAADLRNEEGLPLQDQLDRVGTRLDELTAGHDRLLVGLGQLGARLQRIDSTGARLDEVDVQLRGLQSQVEEADFAEVALQLTRSEQTLQVAMASGARLLQQSLLNYLR